MVGGRPVRIAIANDYELVVAGLATLMADHSDRIEVVGTAIGDESAGEVDVLLFDTFGQVQGDTVDLPALAVGESCRVVIFSWNLDTGLIRRSLDQGAAGYISKSVSVTELVDAIERIHAGETVVLAEQTPNNSAELLGGWPGQDLELSPRESEVLSLITQGFTNSQICERTYLSRNTLKTYIRNLYRKIDVARRSQAVAFGISHGFDLTVSGRSG